MSRFAFALPVSFAAACGLLIGGAHAQCPDEILGPDTEVGHRFGHALHHDGNQIVVGAPGWDDGLGSAPGKVYRFASDGTLLDELFASDGGDGDDFGWDVAASGSTILVGAPGWDAAENNVGRVYVYDVSGGSPSESTLDPGPLALNDGFGTAVDIDGDVAVVAAVPKIIGNGTVFVFRRSGGSWSLEEQFDDLRPATLCDDIAVAVEGDRLAIGTSDEPTGGSDDGVVYVYDHVAGTWTLDAELPFPEPGLGGFDFGCELALEGDVLVTSAPTAQLFAPWPGRAYVFRRTAGTWSHEDTLAPSDGQPVDGFGASLALRGDEILVGAPTEDELGNNSGAVYHFHHDGGDWAEVAKVKAVVPAVQANFGADVALPPGSSAAVMSAEPFGAASPVPGVTRVASLDFGYLDAWSATGPGLAGVYGVPTFTVDGPFCDLAPAVFHLAPIRENTDAFLVMGLSQLDAPFKGGTLVPFPSLVAGPLTTPLTAELGFTTSWPDDLPTGLTLVMQWWIVDPFGVFGFSASNGVSATVP